MKNVDTENQRTAAFVFQKLFKKLKAAKHYSKCLEVQVQALEETLTNDLGIHQEVYSTVNSTLQKIVNVEINAHDKMPPKQCALPKDVDMNEYREREALKAELRLLWEPLTKSFLSRFKQLEKENFEAGFWEVLKLNRPRPHVHEILDFQPKSHTTSGHTESIDGYLIDTPLKNFLHQHTVGIKISYEEFCLLLNKNNVTNLGELQAAARNRLVFQKIRKPFKKIRALLFRYKALRFQPDSPSQPSSRTPTPPGDWSQGMVKACPGINPQELEAFDKEHDRYNKYVIHPRKIQAMEEAKEEIGEVADDEEIAQYNARIHDQEL